jgi:hypothetical protein
MTGEWDSLCGIEPPRRLIALQQSVFIVAMSCGAIASARPRHGDFFQRGYFLDVILSDAIGIHALDARDVCAAAGRLR